MNKSVVVFDASHMGLTMQHSSDVSDALALQIASMPIDEYKRRIDSKLKKANKRSIGEMLENLVCTEAKAEVEKFFPSILEKLACVRNTLTQFIGPEEFDRRYRRLRSQLDRRKKREERLIEKAQESTRRVCFEEQPFVRVRQEAVGHGGFHHGIFITNRPSIRWVYDCGSWRKAGREALRKCIEDFAQRCKRDGNRGISLLAMIRLVPDRGRERLLRIAGNAFCRKCF
jgi:hypothetical protein